jgi:hypothetical protein
MNITKSTHVIIKNCGLKFKLHSKTLPQYFHITITVMIAIHTHMQHHTKCLSNSVFSIRYAVGNKTWWVVNKTAKSILIPSATKC